MSSIALPENFGYVAAPLVSLGWLLFWQGMLVAGARRRAGIAYPQLYAEQAECKENPLALKFNCAQRAHQNTLEFVPSVVIGIVVTGLQCPVAAATLGGGFVLGRIIYTIGYKTGKPSSRLPGFYIGALSSLGLLASATYSAFKLFP